jgi:DNA repair exonuclease SbcCD ATPase subunit
MGQPDMMAMMGGMGMPGMQPPKINALAEMDVDIVIEAAPDMLTLQHEQFEQLADMASKGVPIPPDVLLEASQIKNKKKLIERLKEEGGLQAKLQQAMQQIEQMQKALQAQDAQKAQAEAQKAQMEAARMQMEMQADQQKSQIELQKDGMAAQIKGVELEIKQAELQLKQREMGLKAEEMQLRREEMVMNAQMGEQQAAAGKEQAGKQDKTAAGDRAYQAAAVTGVWR